MESSMGPATCTIRSLSSLAGMSWMEKSEYRRFCVTAANCRTRGTRELPFSIAIMGCGVKEVGLTCMVGRIWLQA